ncbi:hypothetical protein CWB85_01570 [Pseudoalteromonas sp. S1727]|nr:hypothetical protein CWB85_01570 [Pseudoalteromonas sp. S1727]
MVTWLSYMMVLVSLHITEVIANDLYSLNMSDSIAWRLIFPQSAERFLFITIFMNTTMHSQAIVLNQLFIKSIFSFFSYIMINFY